MVKGLFDHPALARSPSPHPMGRGQGEGRHSLPGRVPILEK